MDSFSLGTPESLKNSTLGASLRKFNSFPWAHDMTEAKTVVNPVAARIQQLERMVAQLQQCEGECLTIGEAAQCVSELIDAITDTKSQVDATPGLDPGLRTEIHALLDVLYRALIGSIGPISQ